MCGSTMQATAAAFKYMLLLPVVAAVAHRSCHTQQIMGDLSSNQCLDVVQKPALLLNMVLEISKQCLQASTYPHRRMTSTVPVSPR